MLLRKNKTKHDLLFFFSLSLFKAGSDHGSSGWPRTYSADDADPELTDIAEIKVYTTHATHSLHPLLFFSGGPESPYLAT